MNRMHSFHSRLCHSLNPRLAAIMLIALVTLTWSGLAFCSEIHDAAKSGNLTKIKALLHDNPDLVSSIDNEGFTPLHYAAQEGHKDVVVLLLLKGVDVNAKGNDGWTPLDSATSNDHKGVADLLRQHGGQQHIPNRIHNLIKDLQSSNAVTRAYAAISLGNSGDDSIPAIPNMIKLLGDKTRLQRITIPGPPTGPTTDVRREVAKALGKIGKPALDALLPLCNNERSYAYDMINVVLKNTHDARALDLLIRSLSSEHENVRSGSAVALGNIKDRRAAAALINALQNDREMWVRTYAAGALGEIGATNAVPFLIHSLNADVGIVRSAAVTALGKLKNATAVEPLVNALSDKSSEVRVSAASALGQLKDSIAVNPLITAYKATSGESMSWLDAEKLKIAILKALGDIGDPRATDCLVSAWHSDHDADNHAITENTSSGSIVFNGVGPAALTALGKIGGPNAVNELILALGDKQRHIRGSAALALGKVKDPRGIEPLITVLGNNDTDRILRAATLQALRQITGQTLGRDPEGWKAWWKSNKDSLLNAKSKQ